MTRGMARDKRPRSQGSNYKSSSAQHIWPQVPLSSRPLKLSTIRREAGGGTGAQPLGHIMTEEERGLFNLLFKDTQRASFSYF